MDNRTAIIIQARTGSTRLPNKMILPFYEEKGILEIILNRIQKKYKEIYQIILATTINPNDNKIVEIGNRLGVNVFRGNEVDVLKRFIDTSDFYNIVNIVRVCADNPLIDVNHIEKLIEIGKIEKNDYVSYQCKDKIPVIKSHLGIFTEFTRLKALKKVNKLTSDKLYHEHVTNFIYENTNIFNIKLIDIPEVIKNGKEYRFTLDTKEDFIILQKIYSDLTEDNLNLKNLVEYINKNSELKEIMRTQIINNEK